MKPKVKAFRIRLRRVRRIVEIQTVIIDVDVATNEVDAMRLALAAAGMNNDKWAPCIYSILELPAVSEVREITEDES